MNKKAILFSAGEYYESRCFDHHLIDLPVVKNDIIAMKKRLIQIGFDVTVKEDAVKDEYYDSLQKQVKTSPKDSIHIVYYSGHGGHSDGKNYIYPVDFTTRYEATNSISESAVNLSDIITIYKNKGRLILIIDACRDELGLSAGYYSEMTFSENVYIAYATMFDKTADPGKGIISWFTEAICDEILCPNIDVDTMFTCVRKNVFFKHGTQIPPSVNALIEPVILHSIDSYSNMDKMVYDFVEKFGDEYTDKYGYFQGEDLIFIDAAQYFNISLLDAIWSYKKVDRTLARKKGIPMPELSENEEKIISFLAFVKSPRFYSFDKTHTWYYKGRQIRMGEIPPLPPSMQQKLPEEGKEIHVRFDVVIKENLIYLKTNLPNGVGIAIKTNIDKAYRITHVENGMITISKDEGVSIIEIDSSLFDLTEESNKIVGTDCRNLVGKYIEHHPIYGNQIVAKIIVNQA